MSYTDAQSVLGGSLSGFSLTDIGDSEAQLAFIENLLATTKAMVDAFAARDFDLHTDDEVTLDGNGADQIAVWKDDSTLCVPIIEVTALSVNGKAQDLTKLKVNKRTGIIGYQKTTTPRLDVRRARCDWPVFNHDFQNVDITLSWGYSAPPADIVKAQELLTAALALVTVGGAQSKGIRVKKVEDFEEYYSDNGAYSPQIRQFVRYATETLNKHRTGRKSH